MRSFKPGSPAELRRAILLMACAAFASGFSLRVSDPLLPQIALDFKTGVGAEAWFDFTLGYLAAFTFRLGHARGLSFGGIDKTYFVAAVPF